MGCLRMQSGYCSCSTLIDQNTGPIDVGDKYRTAIPESIANFAVSKK